MCLVNQPVWSITLLAVPFGSHYTTCGDLKLQFSLSHNSHVSSAQQPPVASSYQTGQCRYRTSSSLQKVYWTALFLRVGLYKDFSIKFFLFLLRKFLMFIFERDRI